MAAGWSRKPCPGCGSTHGRGVNSVCSDCHKLLKIGRATVEQAAKPAGPTEVRRIARMMYHTVSPPGMCSQKDDPIYAFTDAMEALVKRLLRWDDPAIPNTYDHTAPVCPRENTSSYQSYNDIHKTTAVDAEDAALLDDLDAAVRAFLRANYNAGLEHGRSLLQQLAQGEITADQFNAKANSTLQKGKYA